MSQFLKPRFAALKEYTPGEQPQDKQYIKLNTNESPYPPSDKVVQAVNAGQVRDLRLYCDPDCTKLKQAMAKRFGVGENNIFLSNGSDDILNFCFMAYGEKGAAFADITYGFYEVFAKLHGVEADIVPLKEDFSLDVEAFKGKNKLVVIANPNAPTGLYLDVDTIERIVKSNPTSVVVVDEAYVDFGGESCYKLIEHYDNLVVCQTFSKSRSLAGGRLGFAFACPALIADLEKIKYSTNPYNINRLTQVAGLAVMEDDGYYIDNCRRIMENRAFAVEQLKGLGFEVLPSKANFIFCRSDCIGGKQLYQQLKEKGILVRHFDKARISDYVRITIGTREQMGALVDAVRGLLGE
ncbi:MAG: histidinol-phosphate transaminase [Oscillospiraceae bacterium]|nr:histidinol-phosphate transaminase [Oscillospiraceae bacterium]